MRGKGLIAAGVLLLVIAGVVLLLNDDVREGAGNTPSDRFEVPAPGGAKDVPTTRQPTQ